MVMDKKVQFKIMQGNMEILFTIIFKHLHINRISGLNTL